MPWAAAGDPKAEVGAFEGRTFSVASFSAMSILTLERRNAFDHPIARNTTDGEGRNPPQPTQLRHASALADPASHGNDREHGRNEQQLADFNSDIGNSSATGIESCGKPTSASALREAQSMQQAERERDDPRIALRQSRVVLPAARG